MSTVPIEPTTTPYDIAAAVNEAPPRATRKVRSTPRWFPRLTRREAVVYTIAALAAINGLYYGLALRDWAWRYTTPIHFHWDANNAMKWGAKANEVGIVELTDGLLAKHGAGGDFHLDYTPLRLLVVTFWTAWTKANFPGVQGWQNSYAFNWPMLWLNTASEIASAVLVFFLVRLWSRRVAMRGRDASEPPPPECGVVAGLLASLLFWFNPAVILDAHCWPQWDAWVFPFYFGALLMASMNRWLLAGVVIGFGCMTKGQLLLVAPLIVMWPLFMGRFTAAARVLVGVVIGGGAVVSPWVFRNTTAVPWVIGVLAASLVLLPVYLRRPRPRTAKELLKTTSFAFAAFLLAMWPWLIAPARDGFWLAYGLTLVLLLASVLLPRAAGKHSIAFALAAAILLGVPLFAGSLSWLWIGFGYPTRHYPGMASPIANLPAILGQRFGWQVGDLVFTLPGDSTLGRWVGEQNVTIRAMTIFIYITCLVICSVAAAVYSRRRDPRVMLAFAAPWVIFFTVLVQMHERYLVWGSGISALLVLMGTTGVLLHLLVTFFGATSIAVILLAQNPNWAPAWRKFLGGMTPDIGWALLLVAMILLYLLIKPAPRETALSRI